jgi:hypothetical protein
VTVRPRYKCCEHCDLDDCEGHENQHGCDCAEEDCVLGKQRADDLTFCHCGSPLVRPDSVKAEQCCCCRAVCDGPPGMPTGCVACGTAS